MQLEVIAETPILRYAALHGLRESERERERGACACKRKINCNTNHRPQAKLLVAVELPKGFPSLFCLLRRILDVVHTHTHRYKVELL